MTSSKKYKSEKSRVHKETYTEIQGMKISFPDHISKILVRKGDTWSSEERDDIFIHFGVEGQILDVIKIKVVKYLSKRNAQIRNEIVSEMSESVLFDFQERYFGEGGTCKHWDPEKQTQSIYGFPTYFVTPITKYCLPNVGATYMKKTYSSSKSQNKKLKEKLEPGPTSAENYDDYIKATKERNSYRNLSIEYEEEERGKPILNPDDVLVENELVESVYRRSIMEVLLKAKYAIKRPDYRMFIGLYIKALQEGSDVKGKESTILINQYLEIFPNKTRNAAYQDKKRAIDEFKENLRSHGLGI